MQSPSIAALCRALAAVLLFALAQAAYAQLKVGDRVIVGSINEPGTIIEIGARQGGTGGTMVKVHLDKLPPGFPNVGSWYDSALSKVSTAGAPPAPAAAAPAAPAARPAAGPAGAPVAAAPPAGAPPGARGGLATCKVGDRVAMPAGFQDKWFDAVVVAVDPSKPYPCRTHPLGYLDTMNESFAPSMLKAPGSIKTEPIGNIANDPQLLAVQGKKAFKPTQVVPGSYECYSMSGGRLVSSMALNFRITGPGRFTDASGASGSYTFDAGSGSMVFQGTALNGQRAKFEQPSNPPSAKTPPNVTFATSGDSCDLKM